MYVIAATITRTVDGWTGTTQLPTFYLDERTQGIVSEDHARRIALRMLTDVAGDNAEVNVSAMKL